MIQAKKSWVQAPLTYTILECKLLPTYCYVLEKSKEPKVTRLNTHKKRNFNMKQNFLYEDMIDQILKTKSKPGHLFSLHFSTCWLSPGQNNPWAEVPSGKTHFRFWNRLPPPQVTLQTLQELQSLQTGHLLVLQGCRVYTKHFNEKRVFRLQRKWMFLMQRSNGIELKKSKLQS